MRVPRRNAPLFPAQDSPTPEVRNTAAFPGLPRARREQYHAPRLGERVVDLIHRRRETITAHGPRSRGMGRPLALAAVHGFGRCPDLGCLSRRPHGTTCRPILAAGQEGLLRPLVEKTMAMWTAMCGRPVAPPAPEDPVRRMAALIAGRLPSRRPAQPPPCLPT